MFFLKFPGALPFLLTTTCGNFWLQWCPTTLRGSQSGKTHQQGTDVQISLVWAAWKPCVRVRACWHERSWGFKNTHTHADTHTQIHTRRYTHADTHTQIHTRRYTHADTHTQIHTRRYTHADTHMQIHTRRYTHADTHTQIHTRRYTQIYTVYNIYTYIYT